MIPQVSTTDSGTAIPPPIGMVNAVLQFNSESNSFVSFSIKFTSSLLSLSPYYTPVSFRFLYTKPYNVKRFLTPGHFRV